MFEPTSRYANLPVSAMELTGPNGEVNVVRWVGRRFVPPPVGTTVLGIHVVTEGERLDVITARYLGDPTQFWRVCDANGVIRPEELTETPGRRLTISLPGF